MKLRVYSRIDMDWNASYFYRVLQPMTVLGQLGLIDPILDRGDMCIPNEQRGIAITYSDIDLFYQNFASEYAIEAKRTKVFPSYWKDKDTPGYPPHFVMDTDDDLFRVIPANSAFTTLGTWFGEGEQGRLLEPGENVVVEFGEHEESEGLTNMKYQSAYVDGKNGFSVAENLSRINRYRQNLVASDLITCSTPRTAEYVKREVPEANTFVIPNCVDPQDYPAYELRDVPGRVRIMWQGSSSHYEDLWPLAPSIVRLTKKHPEIEWMFWGPPMKWVMQNLPADRAKFEQWCPYGEYKCRLPGMNHDIAIAPLTDLEFNRSRSGIKWYESSIIDKPAAMVAQRTGPYLDEITEGETGLLFGDPKEFEEKISALVADAKLRQTLAANSKDWMRTNRDPYKWAPKLYEAYMGLRTARAAAWPPPKPLIEGPNGEFVPAIQSDSS